MKCAACLPSCSCSVSGRRCMSEICIRLSAWEDRVSLVWFRRELCCKQVCHFRGTWSTDGIRVANSPAVLASNLPAIGQLKRQGGRPVETSYVLYMEELCDPTLGSGPPIGSPTMEPAKKSLADWLALAGHLPSRSEFLLGTGKSSLPFCRLFSSPHHFPFTTQEKTQNPSSSGKTVLTSFYKADFCSLLCTRKDDPIFIRSIRSCCSCWSQETTAGSGQQLVLHALPCLGSTSSTTICKDHQPATSSNTAPLDERSRPSPPY